MDAWLYESDNGSILGNWSVKVKEASLKQLYGVIYKQLEKEQQKATTHQETNKLHLSILTAIIGSNLGEKQMSRGICPHSKIPKVIMEVSLRSKNSKRVQQLFPE
ncbi:hypothetical protein ACFE04_017493 [Oxalis oulophora]